MAAPRAKENARRRDRRWAWPAWWALAVGAVDLAGCARTGFVGPPDPCADVACNGHGSCEGEPGGQALCTCEPGYVLAGATSCVVDGRLLDAGVVDLGPAQDACATDSAAGHDLAPADGATGLDLAPVDSSAGQDLAPVDSASEDRASSDGAATDPWPAALDSWAFRKRLVVPARQPLATLDDFPLLVSLVDADLQQRALSSGFDLRFTDAAGAPREHQVERYDAASGTLVAWVKLPRYGTAADSVLYLYYGGDPGSLDPSVATVWSNGFLGVWHLDENGAGQAGEFVDAAGQGNHGTGGGGRANAVPTRVDGQIGRGQDLDGVNDLIVTTPALISNRTALTVTMWARLRSDDNTQHPALAGQNNVLELGFYWNDRINAWSAAMTTLCPGKTVISVCTPDYPLNAWFHLGITWDGAAIVMFVDGVEKHRIPLDALGASPEPFNIGGEVFEASGNNLDGAIDEVRLATTARSPEWLALEHANQLDPASFVLVGAEEAHP